MYLIYISGKYTDKNRKLVISNIKKATEYAKKLWAKGYSVICPHMNTNNFEKIASYETFIEGDIVQINRCDAVLAIPNWRQSKGAKLEVEFALNNDIPVLFSIGELERYMSKNYRCSHCKKTRRKLLERGTSRKVCKECATLLSEFLTYDIMPKYTLTPK